MRLKRLTLESFRGFDALDLHFHPRLTVLVGVNGSGKTSILDALVMLLSEAQKDRPGSGLATVLAGNQGQEAKEQARAPFTFGDHRIGSDAPRTSIRVETTEGHSGTLSWELGFPRKRELASLVDAMTGEHTSVCAYPVRREVANYETATVSGRAYASSLFDRWNSRVDFSSFFRWFMHKEDLENERRRDEPDYRDPDLEDVRLAVERVLPGFSSLRVRRGNLPTKVSETSGPRFTVNKHGVEFDFVQLSEGERILTVLAGDMVRQTKGLSRLFRAERGFHAIVLIDEVDLHLHPLWQANVLPALLRTFPDWQFIVTTHSPLVLSHVESACVRLLEDFAILEAPPTRGRDPNSVLSEVFGAPLRPSEIQAAIDRIAELIDEEHLEQAKAELLELGQILGPSDIEVTRLRGMVELMEA